MTAAKLNVKTILKVDAAFVRAFTNALEGQDVTKFFAVGSGSSGQSAN